MNTTPYEYVLSNKSHTNYSIRDEYLHHLYKRYLKQLFHYDSLEELLNKYRPEVEGEVIYLIAKDNKEIIEEE
jgi:hypothetical protein